jgi:hypothetical protein
MSSRHERCVSSVKLLATASDPQASVSITIIQRMTILIYIHIGSHCLDRSEIPLSILLSPYVTVFPKVAEGINIVPRVF